MNLSTLLAARGRPVRVGLIGAGKFGSMVLAQAQRIPGFHVVGVADLDGAKARASLARVGWPAERYAARSLEEAHRGGTCVVEDAGAQIRSISARSASGGASASVSVRHRSVDSAMIFSIRARSSSSLLEKCW